MMSHKRSKLNKYFIQSDWTLIDTGIYKLDPPEIVENKSTWEEISINTIQHKIKSRQFMFKQQQSETPISIYSLHHVIAKKSCKFTSYINSFGLVSIFKTQ
ncbi:hypothetical protein SS50377_27000 [Spironucleus salmonicida]|uniref:Uncharacterized protein n=1 Tax=Spironucleus salmonicida TaxID=348837 RepID=V6LUY1_9EUKA|nr:hypothetical protein SS50377_27000 [Spironucleus salmonicida]|eukprot:EST47511.1 Hypothetical protein SS50377_12497 [Spironucleus salmonicida]